MRFVELRQGTDLVPVNPETVNFLSKTNTIGKTGVFFPGSNLVVDESMDEVRAKLEGKPLVAI